MAKILMPGTDQPRTVGKILCLGRNYLEHIRELGNSIPDSAVIFCKPASAIITDGESIHIPDYSDDCHHELELAILIGRQGKNIPLDQARSHIKGYAVALDMTLRDVQTRQKTKGLPWEIAKAFDTSCPLSGFVAADQVENPDNIELRLHVNGELRQQGNTAQMMRSVAEIITECSRYFTLDEGDIILTGTPSGVAAVKSGDELVASIDQIGSLRVHVA